MLASSFSDNVSQRICVVAKKLSVFGAASAALFYLEGEMKMSFGENFRKARKTAGLTQEQVALMLNIDRSSVAKYETGKSTPSIKKIPQICKLLNVEIDEIISE